MFRSRRTRSSRVPTLSQALNVVFQATVLGVILAVVYRYCWLDNVDVYKCGAVLNQGRWLSSPRGARHERQFQTWQPPGCMIHNYKAKDIRTCLRSKRMLFIGDSTIRQVFWATAKKLDREGAEEAMVKADQHGDLEFKGDGVDVQFVWDPFLNTSRLHQELIAYRDHPTSSIGRHQNITDSAAVILAGAGLWYARLVPLAHLRQFKHAMDSIVPFMYPPPTAREESSKLNGTAVSAKGGANNLFLIAPVQQPVYEILSPSRAETITADKVNSMNDYLQQLSAYHGADVAWSYSLMTHKRKAAYEESGLHVVESVAAKKADILLNIRCNDEFARSGTYPYDRTCCSSYGRPGWVQWTGLMGGLFLLPGLTLAGISLRRDKTRLPPPPVIRALLVLALAVCYCFYADRTQLFNKIHKHYSRRVFMRLISLVAALGFVSIRRSAPSSTPRAGPQSFKPASDQPFLSRYQTDEWKGWMQFIILIYHYCGASKILWIYQLIRLLVASYLFMTGFGHTVFFFSKGDYSLRRVASVLVRLNLLSCILPYMMRTPYLLYYFAPLVSFWFLVIYFTMKIGHGRNGSLPFLVSKIVVSAIIVTSVTKVPGLLEAIFLVLRYTCRIHWDVTEWRFRVFLDMFIVYIGMLSALLYIKVSAAASSTQPHQRHAAIDRFFSKLTHEYSAYIRTVLIVAALIVILGFWALVSRSPDKYDYNWWQPYISCLPILSFIILRNSHRHLRNFHSSIFAWLGRCSLETFTLQFHIWLAADTKGLLSMGVIFGGRGVGKWEETALLTIIFLWISWCVARATDVLTKWIVDGEFKESPEGLAETERKKSNELPRVKSQVFRGQEYSGFEPANGYNVHHDGRDIFHHWKERFLSRWNDDLRFRLGVLLGIMWIANLVRTPLFT
ncbi:MAG: hypothetical protein M1835_000308 [Candelina submexicana]|nr:MAG: hypothetical protein M1835_000308 [Candelina submexicana]